MAFNLSNTVNLSNILDINPATGPYLTALLAFVLSLAILSIIKNYVLIKMEKFAAKTKMKLDDVFQGIIKDIGWPFYFVVALFIGTLFIDLSSSVQRGFNYLLLIVITYYFIRGIGILIDHYIRIKEKDGKAHEAAVIRLTSRIIKITLWIIAVIFILSNLGLNISSLIAGLGIGGIAIALALQNVLGDVFSSFSIYLDRPFEIGDFILVGEDMGTVKKIGIKSTRLQTLKGPELVISNRELTNVRVSNYKKMKKRRISFTVGVVYATPTTKLKKIPSLVKGVIKKIKLAEADRVHFKEFGPYSLNFDIVYYMLDPAYDKYMDTQQDINLGIKQAFEKEGIKMAFPTQTLFLNK